jgi:hypothetical protein
MGELIIFAVMVGVACCGFFLAAIVIPIATIYTLIYYPSWEVFGGVMSFYIPLGFAVLCFYLHRKAG